MIYIMYTCTRHFSWRNLRCVLSLMTRVQGVYVKRDVCALNNIRSRICGPSRAIQIYHNNCDIIVNMPPFPLL
uniref:Putative ovule protein n=1 Tax=Solanum chacoense TaxID=4108 RepID=A0A0V0H1N7_SOLCH